MNEIDSQGEDILVPEAPPTLDALDELLLRALGVEADEDDE